MRQRNAAYAVLGFCAYALFLLALLPARFVLARVTLPPGLSFEDVEGSIWKGHGRLAWQSAAPVDIDWNWRALPLFSGHLAYDLDAHGSGIEAHARIARGLTLWSVENLAIRGDASLIAAYVPLLSPWQPTGRLQASAARLAWDGRQLAGAADARWTDASLALAPVRPLGTYVLHVEGDGGPARVRVTTTQGALRIAGDGTVEGNGRFAFTGEARAEGPNAQALGPLLDLLGPRKADGSRAIRWAS